MSRRRIVAAMIASQFPVDPGVSNGHITFSSDAPFSIKFDQKSWDGVLEYSTDTVNWFEWDASEISSVDNVLYLRGLGNSVITGVNNATYAMTITSPTNSGVSCTGNIMAFLDYLSPETAVMGAYCFASMFRGCTNLTTTPELPATTLASYCYTSMFYGCTNLTTAPELPATTLASYCYNQMFQGCTNLTVAPELPATVMAERCYYYMFFGCRNLTAAPELPATVLADFCYGYMFRGCTNLMIAPELPATQLAYFCYGYMFTDCTSLTAAPELPATVLADYCYTSMFYKTGIKISETQTGIYQEPWRIPSTGTIASVSSDWNSYMLYDTGGTFTTNPAINTTYYQAGESEPEPEPEQNYLTFSSDSPFSIKFNQKSWDGVLEYSTDTQNWYEWNASEINSSGNVLYLRGMGNTVITNGTSTSHAMAMTSPTNSSISCTGNIMTLLDHVSPETAVMGTRCFAWMFQGCTNLTVAPELPATVLAEYCYSYMFRVTGIVVAPELPATTLAGSCYRAMFFNCTSLTVAPELPATVLADYCYTLMLYGSGIKISETETEVYQTPWSIPSVGTIASEPADWKTSMLTGTKGTFKSDPSKNTTYYQVG